MRCTDRRQAVSASHGSSSNRLETIKSVCVACGGRNLVRYPKQPRESLEQCELVCCRTCGLVAPDANARAPSRGVQDDYTPLDVSKAHMMMDEMLDAVTHDHVKRQLQSALGYAQGDIALICHRYLPVVLDTFAHVVSTYGFANSVDGVIESVRVLADLARNDERLGQQLVRMRQVLTPTGEWLRDDALADESDVARQQLEQDALRRQQEDAQRTEELNVENARLARLRARKVALGLDPTEPRLPRLLEMPPADVVTHAGHSVQLRVHAQLATSFQWFVNGKPLTADDALVQGVQRNVLHIARLTKRTESEYVCECTNEEGATRSRSCRVATVTLRTRRLASHKLRGLANAPLVSLGWKRTVVSCVTDAVLFIDASTLAVVRVLPALPSSGHQTLAWSASTKLLVSASSVRSCRNELALVALDVGVEDASAALAPAPPASTLHVPRRSSVSNSTSVIARALGTHCVKELDAIHTLQFFDDGRLLLASDMKHCVAVCALVPTLHCAHRFVVDGRISHIASCAHERMFAVAVRGDRRLRLYHTPLLSLQHERQQSAPNEFVCVSLAFQCVVDCSAFDASGFALAVAESSCLRAWISVVDVRLHTQTRQQQQQCRVPSKSRFEAHVGKVTCLQWTTTSALLVSSGLDGYVKVWDVEAASACVHAIRLDDRGVHSFTLVAANDAGSSSSSSSSSSERDADPKHSSSSSESDDAVLLALGYSECQLQSRAIPQLRAFEATRLVERNAHATTIQRRWKGRQTRALVRKFISK